MAKERKKQSEQQKQNPFSSFGGGGGDNDPANINVIYGSHAMRMPLAGLKVSAARQKLVDEQGVSISPDAIPTLDAHQVDDDTVIQEGQSLMFIKPSVEKGNTSATAVVSALANPHVERDQKAEILYNFMTQASNNDKAHLSLALTQVVEDSKNPEVIAACMEILEDMKLGPKKPCVVGCNLGKFKAGVIAGDGAWIFPSKSIDMLFENINVGDTVLVDTSGTSILEKIDLKMNAGPVVRILRANDDGTVELQDTHGERIVAYLHHDLLNEDLEGKYAVYDSGRKFVVQLAEQPKIEKRRFVDYSRTPDVRWDRDVANPHPAFQMLVQRTRSLMFDQAKVKKFCVQPFVSMLCSGPTGTGKTHHIAAFQNSFYEMVEEKLGFKPDFSRIVRAKMSQLTSEWFGRSEKLVEELFDDIIYLSNEEVEDSSGNKATLPVVVIMEEADAFAQVRRDDGSGGVHNRVMTTLLQRLDDANDSLKNLPIVFISTTNKPQNIDAAMLRRLGGVRAEFGRLGKSQCCDLLNIRVPRGYPLVDDAGSSVRRDVFIRSVVQNLWDDQRYGVEVSLASKNVMPCFPKDFLTPAILDCAFSECANALAFEYPDIAEDDLALSPSMLVDKVHSHVSGIVRVLNQANAADHVTVPEGDRVVGIKPIVKSYDCEEVY